MTKKSKGGEESTDFPSVNTADCNRSHLKNYLLHTYKVFLIIKRLCLANKIKVDLDDKLRFPDWGIWWKAYQGEVLKPRGKMQVCRINCWSLPPHELICSIICLIGTARVVSNPAHKFDQFSGQPWQVSASSFHGRRHGHGRTCYGSVCGPGDCLL